MSIYCKSSVRTIAHLVDAAAAKFPDRLALTSPFQGHKFTYAELSKTTQELAGFLSMYGYEKKDLMVSDLPNTTENLFVQLACNRLGLAYCTTKNLEQMAKLPKVKGAICADDTAATGNFLSQTNLPLPYLTGDFLQELIHDGGLDAYSMETEDSGNETTPHAFYNSTDPFTNPQALKLGEDSSFQLAMYEQDVVCVSVTLSHAFGFGSAVSSALMMGAAICLPAVGGIRGCGVPSERAAATLEVLKSEKCTLLFADTHTLEALPEPPLDLVLRGGVCKIASGSDFLEQTRTYGGVKLMTMGKK